MRIKELAQRTNLTPHTIRFYEKVGLLDSRHISRDKSGYRNYSPAAIERVHMIKKFQGIGCTLIELKDVLHSIDTNGRTNDEIVGWIQHKIDEIEQKRSEFDQMLTTLRRMLAHRKNTK